MLVEALVERDGMTCTWCCCLMIQLPITLGQDCDCYLTIEHLIPLVKGGTNDLCNLALACYGCNNKRGADVDWAHELG